MTSHSQTPPNSMPQLTFVLRISGGSFASGFSASLSISEPGRINPQQRYQLPSNADLPAAYSRWQRSYGALTNTRIIQPVAGQKTQQSHEERRSDCRKETIAFEDNCSEWFHRPTFEALRRSIFSEAQLRQVKQILLLLEADTNDAEQDILLRKLPWHLWKLLEQDLRSSEMILSAPVAPSNHQFSSPVSILAVFGSQSGGIQLNGDLEALEKLKPAGANLVLLNQPTSKELQEALWKQRWDVLFFAGHSSSCKDSTGGLIYLKNGDVLSLRDLKASLNRTVENGLKLAIFNSCDGLSLSNYLADRRVPVSIVMREPVPDLVARHFLEYFLEEFSQGQLNLSAAVRKARERLQWLETNGSQACPAATWLPIICQNPNQSPLFWPTAAASPPVAPPAVPPVVPPTVLQSSPPPVTPAPAVLPPVSAPPNSRPSGGTVGSPTTVSSGIQQKKFWRMGALALFILMVLVKCVPGPWKNSADDELEGSGLVAATVEPVDYDSLQDRFSEGDRILIRNEAEPLKCSNGAEFESLKQSGADAMRDRSYELAYQKFTAALDECPSPEARIYQNNAAIGAADAYTLAVTVPYSPYPDNAVQMLRGAATAQLQINDDINGDGKIGEGEGINGKPLKLVIVEDGDDPAVAVQIANELINNRPDVIGALGHWTSGVSDKAFRIYENEEKLAFITPVSTFTGLIKASDEWVFRATIDGRKSQRAIVDYIENIRDGNQLKKVAIFYIPEGQTDELRSLYSEDLTRQFKTAFSGTIVGKFSLVNPKFKTEPKTIAETLIKEAKSQGAEAILIAPNSSSVSAAAAIIKAAGKENLPIFGEVNLFRLGILEQTCSESIGMVLALPWYPGNSAEGNSAIANTDFVERAKREWGGQVSAPTAMTYNATQAMITAIQQSPDNPNRESVKDALNRADFKVAGADADPFSFDSSHNRVADAQLVEVVADDNANFGCRFQAIE